MARPKKPAVEKRTHALERLNVEYVQADSVQPNSYNPNRQSDHDFELLVSSMREDGFTQPIIVQRGTREIIDGEHRWTCAIVCCYLDSKGIAYTSESIRNARNNRAHLVGLLDLEIPVAFADMPPEQMMISTLRHNRARGSEDVELTAQVMRDLRSLGALEWAQDSLALSDLEVQRMLDDVPAPAALAAVAYSEAWEPATKIDGNTSLANAGEATQDDATRLRLQAQRLNEASDAEERATIRRELDTFRVSLIYTGENAALVRAVLGGQPATRLIELCQEYGNAAAMEGVSGE